MRFRPLIHLLSKVAIVLVFFLVAGIVVLSAYGYTYDRAANKIEPTGIIIVNGSNKDLHVLLDSKEISQALPTRILGVKEGNHTVEVQKAGFLPWKMSVLVTNGLVSQIPFILLAQEKPADHFQQLFSLKTLFAAKIELVGASQSAYIVKSADSIYWFIDVATKKKTRMTFPKDLHGLAFLSEEKRGYGLTADHQIRQFSLNNGKVVLGSLELFPYTSDGLRFLQFSKDFQSFLFARSGEVVGISRDQNDKETLFTRLGDPIRNLAWFYDTHHFVINVAGKLQFCDEHFMNCYELLTLAENDSFAVDSQGVYVLSAKDQSIRYLKLLTSENTFLSYIFSEQVSL